jgi:AcrR family transcriptional regulator
MADLTTAATAGLRERKKAQVRATILREALRLFRTNGFGATTVETIAAACDISPASVYRYFPTKEDIVFADAEEQGDHLVRLIGEQPAELAPNQALYGALLLLADDYATNGSSMRNTSGMIDQSTSLRARKAEAHQRWERGAVAALQARASSAGYDETMLRFMTATALSAFRVATEIWLENPTQDLHALVELSSARLTDGFGR